MTDKQDKQLEGETANKPQKAVDIQPSEPKTSERTIDPGRTPGKAEGADDESATR